MNPILILPCILGFVLLQVVLFFVLRHRLRETFNLLANRALVENNQHFVELAKMTLEKFQTEAQGELTLKQHEFQGVIKPLKQSLEKYKDQVEKLELKREQAYGGLRQYIEDVSQTQGQLRKETGNLVKALRASHVRGKWGEMNLQRVVELAGMVEHCDFTTQTSLSTEDSRLRPDLIVQLPNQRRVVIDAKVPLDSYLQAVEAEDEKEQERFMTEHSRQLKRHIQHLGSKSYWEYLEGSPEFVILYIPLESLFSSALRRDPDLLDIAAQRRVVMATPTILIALLKSIDHGWNQEKLAHNAAQISAMGKELYDRLSKMAEHFSKLGINLQRAVHTYNETAGSFEHRVFSQARRFKDLGVPAKEEIPEVNWVDSDLRQLQQSKQSDDRINPDYA